MYCVKCNNMNSIRIVMMQKKNMIKIVLKLKLIYVKLQNSPIYKYETFICKKKKNKQLNSKQQQNSRTNNKSH